MTSLSSLFERRERALFTKWMNNSGLTVSVNGLSELKNVHFLKFTGADDGSTVFRLNRRQERNCVFVPGGSDKDADWSFWVRRDFTGYRAAFADFITMTYGITVRKDEFSSFHVDHLMNKERLPHPDCFVRVEATLNSANTSWATYEKFMGKEEKGGRRTASAVIFAKLGGLKMPTGTEGRTNSERIEAIVWHFKRNGLKETAARQHIKSMIGHAYGEKVSFDPAAILE